MTNIYTNDTQVVFRGALKCVMIFTPNEAPEGGGPPSGGGSLLIDRMEFNTVSFVEFIARASVKRQPIYRVAEPAQGSSHSSRNNADDGGDSGSGGVKTASTPAGQAPTPGMTPSSTASALPAAKAADKGKGRESAISEVDEDGKGIGDDADNSNVTAGARAKYTAGHKGSDLVAADLGEGSTSSRIDQDSTTASKPAKPPLPLEVIGETVTMPDQVINAYGISDGALRCLEVSSFHRSYKIISTDCPSHPFPPADRSDGWSDGPLDGLLPDPRCRAQRCAPALLNLDLSQLQQLTHLLPVGRWPASLRRPLPEANHFGRRRQQQRTPVTGALFISARRPDLAPAVCRNPRLWRRARAAS